MKAAGAGGAASVFPSAVAGSGADQDVQLVDSEPREPEIAQTDARALARDDIATSVADAVDEATDFELSFDEFVSIELTTTDEDLNERNPAVAHLPMKPEEGRFTPDNGGVLFGMTVDHEGERKLVSALGIVREEAPSRFRRLFGDGRSVSVRAFGEDEDGIGEVARARDTRVGAVPGAPDVQSVDGQIPDVSCFGCTSIVGTACAGASVLSFNACASAAISAGVFSPWAGGAAAAFCVYIVSNAGTLTCTAGTAAICASAGFCEVVE